MLASGWADEGFFRWVGSMSFEKGLEPEALSADEYAEWLQKFEAKKTTDDCYTPPAVYKAVLSWAMAEYALEGRRVLRPFRPDGDFMAFDYQAGDVVIDNPPFSILTKIRRWYDLKGVDYLLFAPALTLFDVDAPCSIVVHEGVTYANGAVVNTSFITNLDAHKIRTAPSLKSAIRWAVEGANTAAKLPKYNYPDHAVTAAQMGKVASIELAIPAAEVSRKLSRLDDQRASGKGLFGGGFLISDRAAAEVKAAEVKAKQEAIEWQLSDNERDIVARLSGRTEDSRGLF